MSPLEKKRAALKAYRQQTKSNPEYMALDDLREYAERHGVEYAWIKGRVELYEDLKKVGVYHG